MATFTSSQSGNFSSSATWGGAGVPGDGDRFDVSSAHTVTIDSSISVPTNGYADSYVYGILQSQSGTNNTLRMNGRLYIKGNGTLHLRDGAKIQIKGVSGDQHGIWQENEAGASVIMEGSDGMPSTTTSSALSIGAEYIPVSSASSFGVGDWISVFDNVTGYTGTNESYPIEAWSDEGFWIHDISGNNIYFRIFVSPDATITKVSGSTITVDNAKVFRVGQKIIFNTGSNRNVRSITALDYVHNVITLNSNVTNASNQIGAKVYLTGIEKAHVTSSKVRKMATVTTSESASTATTIVVSSISKFSVGDEIYIERKSEADSTTDYAGWWSASEWKDQKHTISGISGNTITLSSAIGYRVVSGSLVTRMSRDILVECLTPGTDHGFFYCEHLSDWSRKLILKDVYFKNWGNDDSSVYTGVVVRGHNNTSSLPVTLSQTIPSRTREPWMEGLVVHVYPDVTHQLDWGPIWSYDCRGLKIRNCMVMHGDDGISLYYEPHVAIYNSLTTGQDSFAFRIEGASGVWEFAYNYSTRNVYGFRFYTPYELGLGIHDCIGDSNQYAFNLVTMSHSPRSVYRSQFTGHRFGINNEHSSGGSLYCKVRSLSGYPQPYNDASSRGTVQDGQYRVGNFYSGNAPYHKSIEHDFEHDHLRLFGYRSEVFWDTEERAWRFFRRYDSSENPGLLDTILLPAGVTMRISAKIKLDPDFSGTYPYLGVRDEILSNYNDFWGTGQGSNPYSGNRSLIQYTSAAANNYEEKQITYGPYDWTQTVVVGVFSNSNNAAEGYWIKDMKVMLDHPYASPALYMSQRSHTNTFIQVRNTFTQQKKRLGGRLR